MLLVWAGFYLINKNAVVRYTHFGEGRYRETEAAIASLLKQEYPTENK
ncbi:MAG: hypothetical protein OEM27_04030 [Nitrospinota bacterium]|nr:hypothetical protein [Nitrospinota bacterium]